MKLVLISILGLFLVATAAWAETEEPKKPNFRYGTTCYTSYGARTEGNITKAVIAVKEYFAKDGFDVKILGHTRRFLRVDVYKDDEMVDSIIVDIATGKMRSIH